MQRYSQFIQSIKLISFNQYISSINTTKKVINSYLLISNNKKVGFIYRINC
jgi:hypothetical protein